MAARRRKFGPSQKERIFFACLPDAAAAARIHARAESFKREHGFTGALILPEHLHVTLFHLGDWAALPEEIVGLAKGAAAQVRAHAFEAAFARAESFRTACATIAKRVVQSWPPRVIRRTSSPAFAARTRYPSYLIS